MKRKKTAVFLAVMLTSALMSGCSSQKEKEDIAAIETAGGAISESGDSFSAETPLPEKTVQQGGITYPYETDITLKIYTGGMSLPSTYSAYEDVPFWKGLIENIGIDCEWVYPPTGTDAAAAYNMLLQDEELPHIIVGYIAQAADMAVVIEDGVALNVYNKYELYAPDYYKMLMAEDEYMEKNRKLAALEDGTIPVFIGARSTPWGCTYIGPVIRQDWLDLLELETPETIQDVEDVLVTFKEEYDAFFTNDRQYPFVGAVGAYAGFNTNFYVDENEVIQYANVQQEWKDWLTLMNSWYQIGILDPNIATADRSYLAQMALEEKIGLGYTAIGAMTNWINQAAEAGLTAEWVGFAHPTNEAGDPLTFIQTEYSTYAGSFGAYLTNACDTQEELEAAMAWLNWAYTEEGMRYWNFGTEGVSYEIVNGIPQFTETLWKDERGIDQAVRDYSGAGAMPLGLQLEEFVRAKNDPVSCEAVDFWIMNQNAADYIVPSLPLTTAESQKIADINSQLNTYVTEMAYKFVLGQEKLTQFDSFVEMVYGMGLQTALDIQNAAYQRYLGK